MMPLHTKIKFSDLADEERFDFLKGLVGMVKRVDEVHPSEANDSYYLFLIWLQREGDEGAFTRGLRKNIRAIRREPSNTWDFRLTVTRFGMVILHAWV